MTAPQDKTEYPLPPTSKAGQADIDSGNSLNVWLESFDGTRIFHMMGGKSIARDEDPECVLLTRNGFKGLMAQWQMVEQKAATQDGATFVADVFDPMEIEMKVVVHGRTVRHCQHILDVFIASIDSAKPARLHVGDTWWCEIRWSKTLPDRNNLGESRSVNATIVLTVVDGFWRTDAQAAGAASSYTLSNPGDRDLWPDILCEGPGTFTFQIDSPGGNSAPDGSVTFGPLLSGQQVMVRTDPTKPTLVDLTSTPPPVQDLSPFQQLIDEFATFAFGKNLPPLIVSIESWFGISPPQGNLYALLQGRFASRGTPVPVGDPDSPPSKSYGITVTGGGSATVIGVPRRRYPRLFNFAEILADD